MNAKAQKRVAARQAAMPEVKRLCKKYGRSTIANCIGKIRDVEKLAQKLADLKRESARLEKKV